MYFIQIIFISFVKLFIIWNVTELRTCVNCEMDCGVSHYKYYKSILMKN